MQSESMNLAIRKSEEEKFKTLCGKYLCFRFPREPEGALILILSYYPSVKIRLSTIYTVKGEIVPRFRIL